MSSADTTRASPDPATIAVIVTGAARGMGRAMTLGLARAGVRVVAADLPSSHEEMRDLLDRRNAKAQQDKVASDRLRRDPMVRLPTCRQSCDRAISARCMAWSTTPASACRASDTCRSGQERRFYEHDADAWRRAIDANVNGPFMMAKAIAPTLVAQGWGRIVNIVTSHFTMVMDGFRRMARPRPRSRPRP